MILGRQFFERVRPRVPWTPGNVGVGPVSAWASAVVANGGSVSAGRVTALNTLVSSLLTAGTWELYDDIYLLAAESETQALTSLKQRRLATATAAPTFTTDRGYAFNGTSQYIDTGFIASTHAVAMTGSDMRIASYERTNLASVGYTAGAFTASTSNLRIRARNGANAAQGNLNSSALSFTNSNSLATVAISRTAGGTFEGWYRGASLGTASPTSETSLPTHAIYIGAFNNAGTAASFRAASVAVVTVGASFSSAQEAADYTAWQDFLTVIGAQV